MHLFGVTHGTDLFRRSEHWLIVRDLPAIPRRIFGTSSVSVCNNDAQQRCVLPRVPVTKFADSFFSTSTLRPTNLGVEALCGIVLLLAARARKTKARLKVFRGDMGVSQKVESGTPWGILDGFSVPNLETHPYSVYFNIHYV